MSVITENLVKSLSEGPVTFKYRKADGTIRSAKGTTKIDLIPEANRPATATTNAGSTVSYYDLDSNGWRSFRRDAIVTA